MIEVEQVSLPIIIFFFLRWLDFSKTKYSSDGLIHLICNKFANCILLIHLSWTKACNWIFLSCIKGPFSKKFHLNFPNITIFIFLTFHRSHLGQMTPYQCKTFAREDHENLARSYFQLKKIENHIFDEAKYWFFLKLNYLFLY